MDADSEVLKLGLLFADIVNGIMHEFGSIIMTSASVVISGLLALILPGTIFVITGIAYLIYADRKYLKTTEDSKLITTVNIVISIFIFFGSILHYVGDNLPSLAEQLRNDVNETVSNNNLIAEINSIQLFLLVMAVLMYRILPYGFGKLIEMCSIKDEQNTKENKMSDKRYSSIFKEAVFASIVTIEFEAWFTVTQSAGTCSRIQLALVWTWWVVMFIVYGLVLIARITIHVHTSHNILLWSRYLVGITIGIFLSIAFGLYLLGDNMQPLNCYQDLSDKDISIVKLCALCVSLLSFVTPLGSYPLVKSLDRKLNKPVSRDIEQHESSSNEKDTRV